MRVQGKRAVVTGAGRGIGRAVALMLAREGARVVVHSLSAENANSTAGAIEQATGQRAVPIFGPIDQPETASKLLSAVTDAFGTLDILVNNAGIDDFGPVDVVEIETWDRVIAVNLNGTFLACRALLPLLRSRGGAIVNVSSASALVGCPGMSAYTASKGAVVSLTRQMAIDYASVGIRVNSVCPGSIDTPMLRAGIDAADDPASALSERTALHPLGRIGSPEDVAYGVLYLASDEAGFVTGANLVIDGGMTSR